MAHSPNVTWHEGSIGRTSRWAAIRGCGATVWITGLPSSGKSTLAAAVERELVERGLRAYVLDGDNLRHGICGDLGFCRDDRVENVRRVGELARLFADSGTIAVVSLVSPYADTREEVRRLHEDDDLPFLEVFVNTPVGVCASRDPKGLYARAMAGQLEGFTGIDDPYEPPRCPDLEITPDVSLQAAGDAVVRALEKRCPILREPGDRPGAERHVARAPQHHPHVAARPARVAAASE